MLCDYKTAADGNGLGIFLSFAMLVRHSLGRIGIEVSFGISLIFVPLRLKAKDKPL